MEPKHNLIIFQWFHCFCRPCRGFGWKRFADPGLAPWAILCRPFGTEETHCSLIEICLCDFTTDHRIEKTGNHFSIRAIRGFLFWLWPKATPRLRWWKIQAKRYSMPSHRSTIGTTRLGLLKHSQCLFFPIGKNIACSASPGSTGFISATRRNQSFSGSGSVSLSVPLLFATAGVHFFKLTQYVFSSRFIDPQIENAGMC